MTTLKEAPAPWVNMKAEGYSFFSITRTSDVLPSSTYDPLERKTAFADPEVSGHFAGGLGTLMIVRYLESPCGPYDELVLFPGDYKVPVRNDGSQSLRITRIYVSTAASVFNGRRNWNIPKRLANFTFVSRTDGYQGYARVEVRLPGEQKPFFAVDLTPSWLSSVKVPLSSAYLPVNTMIVQPPLPQGDEPERIGTDKWQAITPYMRGKGSVVYASGGLGNGEWSDGIGMPPMNRFYSLGVQWHDFLLDFSESTDPAQ
jgi:hypothetical protein